MFRQFTSTCYILWKEKFLFIYHAKHKKWLPPGGHREGEETPPETARREVLEETGLEIAFIKQENVWVDDSNAKSIERPFSILLESLPATKNEPAHEHIDFIYLATPTGGELTDGKWLSAEEVEDLEDIFPDTKKTVRFLAQNELLV